jgi:hypothetical protein
MCRNGESAPDTHPGLRGMHRRASHEKGRGTAARARPPRGTTCGYSRFFFPGAFRRFRENLRIPYPMSSRPPIPIPAAAKSIGSNAF